MSDYLPVKRALISVSDKTDLVLLASKLAELNIEILSTGGSAKALREAGLSVIDVSDVTGFPEIMDGRVKTLHPSIHGGLLGRRNHEGDKAAMSAHNITGIDLVVVNLYPFEATIASGADFDTGIENIDIGGPAMIRASAKNHAFVTIVTDPSDYAELLAALEKQGGTDEALRRKFAYKAFSRTAAYDAAIHSWLAGHAGDDVNLPHQLSLTSHKTASLRYGENPHQAAAAYQIGEKVPSVLHATQLQGKALSYNNLNDTDAAFQLASEFDKPAIAIIKHANPCGVATADTLSEAWDKALSCDPVSAFGGIIAMNRPLDKATATKITSLFTEVVIAPEADDDAIAIMGAKPNLRLLVTGGMADTAKAGIKVKSIAGGLLAQSVDNGHISEQDLQIVTKVKPNASQLEDMLFAWKVAKHVKSNAIIYVRDTKTVGIGAGQMSRIDSCKIAAEKAKRIAADEGLDAPRTIGSVVASDAFFPFADGLLEAIEAGANAVIQPGGSMRDDAVIKAADDAGIAMVFTGMRHFNH
ncbi:MAG: bifunctional phosphoribosylaminoimidazolecarboxamide formyltransferase/IMP cyclohydrolase [Candidatus Puniceispirillaceae bacterium]